RSHWQARTMPYPIPVLRGRSVSQFTDDKNTSATDPQECVLGSVRDGQILLSCRHQRCRKDYPHAVSGGSLAPNDRQFELSEREALPTQDSQGRTATRRSNASTREFSRSSYAT